MVDIFWSPGIILTGTVMGLIGLVILFAFGRKFEMELDNWKTWAITAFIPWFAWQATLFAHFLINYVWVGYIPWYHVFTLAWWTENPMIQTVNPIAFGITNPIGAILTWGTEYLSAFIVIMIGSAFLHKAGVEPR